MPVLATFTTIVQDSVPLQAGEFPYELYPRFTDYDPVLAGIDNWFYLPPYGKALSHYKAYHPRTDPEEVEFEDDRMDVTYSYKWILDGFIKEVNINVLTADDKGRYLEDLRGLFEGWQPAKETYLATVEKLSGLPDVVAMSYPTQIDRYRRAANGAIKVITEGLKHVNTFDLTTNQRTIATDRDNKSHWEGKNNTFNNMSLRDVETWFMQLADNKNTNGKPFLTIEQVRQFINRAFVNSPDVSKLSFNITTGESTSITKLFYLFFDTCRNNRGIEAKRQCKDKYVRLLTDNFTNHDYKAVFGNWNNSKNAPMDWNTTI